MVDKEFCMSSFLTFRYIIDDTIDFGEKYRHQVYSLIPEEKRILVDSAEDINTALEKQFSSIYGKKIGILLSGGMDSACLASFLSGCDAYTFRFMNGNYQKDELERAEYYANKFKLTLHYVDIGWDTVSENLEIVMKKKGAPVHSIEPQILAAVKQAKKDGIEIMVIGDAADYVFGGMDGLYANDWTFDEFVERDTYVKPEEVLVSPVDMRFAFEKYRCKNKIDFVSLMHEYTDVESYASYENAFNAGNMPFLDPYEILKMRKPLDLYRIRTGDSKYLIRDLFRLKYPEMEVPTKLPMPRPVDEYFKTWEGPTRPEFKSDLDMSRFNGNQKWLLFCLEQFLNLMDKQ